MKSNKYISFYNRFLQKFPHLSFLSPVEIFTNLHVSGNLDAAKEALRAKLGVYGIINTITGRMYIGSTNNIAYRLVQHMVYGSSNEDLNSSLREYGLQHFIFVVLVFCGQEGLLIEEQQYLDWLFTLPEEFRYNFAIEAVAPFTGRTHTVETKAKISKAIKGKTNARGTTHSEELRARISENLKGNTNKAIPVFVKDMKGNIVRQFPSCTACGEFYKVSTVSVSRYIRSGKVFQSKYLLTSSRH